jgi:hypothetical protein
MQCGNKAPYPRPVDIRIVDALSADIASGR